MMWIEKTFLQSAVENFYAHELIENEKDKVYLDMAAAYYNVWFFMVRNQMGEERIAQQEVFITEEVKHQWGDCYYHINRGTYTFIVRHPDGRSVSLSTGRSAE